MACGLDWSEPVSHFENVDFHGNVHIVRKLGEVEKLPIYLIFNSSYGNSPYVGSGFEIPLLESRMWQVDEIRFQMKSPDGWLWIFQRTKAPNVLEGNAGWKGLIKDDTITVWAPCGDKIYFKNGNIVSMQLKSDKFDYAYKDKRVESIQKNGRTILEVKSDDKTGDVTGINLPNTREVIALQQAEIRPKVQSVAGTTVVTRVDKTLGEVRKLYGTKEMFEFSVDENLNSTLKIEGTMISWNSATGAILRDGPWTYDIKPNENKSGNAAIGRRNSLNQTEFWFDDYAGGHLTTLYGNNVKIIKDSFTSGNLRGKTRKILVAMPREPAAVYNFRYDENGKILRVTDNSGQEIYTDDKGLKMSLLMGGPLHTSFAKLLESTKH